MSWDQALAIQKENKELLKRATGERPVSCPICGEPLDELRGVLNCKFGHYRYG